VFYHNCLGSQITTFSSSTKEFLIKADEIHLQDDHATAQLGYYLKRIQFPRP
jgi:hypothetical protein